MRLLTNKVLVAAKICVPLVVSFFIGRMIHANWVQVRAEPWQLDIGLLALSFALGATWHLARPWGWMRLIRGFGHRLRYGDVYRIYRQSEVSRYVPGGVWQFASRIYLMGRLGVKPASCLAATLLDMSLAALAAMVPAAWLAGAAASSLGLWQRYALLAFPFLASALVHPKALNAWAAPLARLLKQPYRNLEIRPREMLAIWASYVAATTLLALAMATLARSLLPGIGMQQFAFIAGCYALAWVAAMLTMVAPAGMGIREGILGLLLTETAAAGTALTLAVAMRLWVVCMELVWLTAGQLAWRKDPPAAR